MVILKSKKLKASGGFTLTELLMAIMVLSIIMAALGVLIPSTLRTYKRITQDSEASVLCSTLASEITSEMRYGVNFVDAGDFTYDSALFGEGVKVTTSADGIVFIGTKELVAKKAYTSELKASITLTLLANNNVDVKIDVYSDEHGTLAASEFTVDPINV